MAEIPHALLPLAVLLAAGAVSAGLLPHWGIPMIFGYLLAGVLVGPSGTGLVSMTETVHLLAEFGVIFLLFDVGLHFSLKQLWENRRDFLGLGPLQWSVTTIALAGIFWLLGFSLTVAALIAGALALSSTAVALQTLHDRGERGTPLAQSATALLIFQDVVAIVLLAVVGADVGESSGGAALLSALGKAAVAIAAVGILGRLLRPAFAWIISAGTDEAFTAFALLVVVVTAGLTGLAGLSLPLGAFLGGMLLSESEYCYMIKAELKPFRALLLGLFFITVGMEIDVAVVADAVAMTFALAVTLLIVKGLVILMAAVVCRSHLGPATRLAFSLAQGSEFAFVILGVLAATGALSGATGSILVAAVVLTMAATPALAPVGDRFAAWLERRALGKPADTSPAACRVLINGASDAELAIANALRATGNSYLAIDPELGIVARARARGFAAGVANLEDGKLADDLTAEVDAVVLGRAGSARLAAVVEQLRRRRPDLEILMRAARESDAVLLRDLGATVWVAPDDTDDRAVAEQMLRYLNVSSEAIDSWAKQCELVNETELADKAHAA
jgi:CPA2 family monovalent cation:H+ antiporter-2